MNDPSLTGEIESLIQGYAEGDLAAQECMRLRELLETSPGLITPLLAVLRTDELIRRTMLQNVDTSHEFTGDYQFVGVMQKRKRLDRFAVAVVVAASFLAITALATVLFVLFKSHRAAPDTHVASAGEEGIWYERWEGIPGGSVADLTTHRRFHQQPSSRGRLTDFELPLDQNVNFGTRIRGYLHPPVSGTYLFWITADDAGELWLSTNESPGGKQRICFVESWTGPREWNFDPSQQSSTIRLEAGRRYYIEALHKQGAAGASLSVAWQPPGGRREVIPGRNLSPFVQNNPP